MKYIIHTATPEFKTNSPTINRFKPALKISSINGNSISDQFVGTKPWKKKIRVLSLEGGGIRGIIPATILGLS